MSVGKSVLLRRLTGCKLVNLLLRMRCCVYCWVMELVFVSFVVLVVFILTFEFLLEVL